MDVPSNGGIQPTTMIDRRTFIMWLTTVDASRLKDERAKALLVAYQKEAADVLDAHFFGKPVTPPVSPDLADFAERVNRLKMLQGLVPDEVIAQKAEALLAADAGASTPVGDRVVRRDIRADHINPLLDMDADWFTSRDYVIAQGYEPSHTITMSFNRVISEIYRSHGSIRPTNDRGRYRRYGGKRVISYIKRDLPLLNEAWDKIVLFNQYVENDMNDWWETEEDRQIRE